MADETSGSVLGGLVAPSTSAPPSPAPPKPPDFSGIPGHVEVTPTAQVTDKVVPQDHPIWQRIKDFSNLPSSEYDQKYAADDAAVSDRIKHAAETVVPLLKTFDEAQPAIEKTAVGKQVSDFAKDQLSHPEQFAMGGEFGALGGVESAESGAIRSALEKLPGYISPTKPAPDFSSIPGHVEIPTTETVQVRPQDFISKVSRGHLDPKVVNDYRMKIRGGEDLPPASISFDSEGNITDADGRHRALAHLQEGSERMPVKITRNPDEGSGFQANASLLRPRTLPSRISTQSIGNHEAAHAIVGEEVGLVPLKMHSHLHPNSIEKNLGGGVAFDWGPHDPKNLSIDERRQMFKDVFGPMAMAGGVAQKDMDGVPFETNPNLEDDKRLMLEYGTKYGFSADEIKDIGEAGKVKAREILDPHHDIIRKYTADREDGLDTGFIMSPEKMNRMLSDIAKRKNQ